MYENYFHFQSFILKVSNKKILRMETFIMDKKLICKVPCNDERISIEYYFFKGKHQNYVFSIHSDGSLVGYRWIVPIIYDPHKYEDFVDLAEGYFEDGFGFYSILDHFFDREIIGLESRESFLKCGFYIDLEGNYHYNETD